jgi:NAD(P)H-dependent flavin oxidoreductase YrpB (nitropropane dioxygenase family)
VRQPGETSKMAFTSADGARTVGAKTWKDIWSAGQGVGSISDIPDVDELAARLREQFREAKARICSLEWM